MIKTFPDVPDWKFNVEEVSAGVYEVVAFDSVGRRLNEKGTDIDQLIGLARDKAKHMADFRQKLTS